MPRSQTTSARQLLAANVRRLRIEREWSQEQLGERASLSQGYVSEVESARRKPTIDVLDQLARAFDLPVHRLLLD